jgi:mRNA-degrading endonuclease RelE of RelBE toxin-antitoxin system
MCRIELSRDVEKSLRRLPPKHARQVAERGGVRSAGTVEVGTAVRT